MRKNRQSEIARLAEWVRSVRRIAVLSGAGISTDSGIPDFRSAGGWYSDARNVNVFDLEAFLDDPRPFYRFAREFYPRIINAQPNRAHRVLAKWERERGKEVSIATQNVDDFHQRAGSTRVFGVHGDFRTSTCMACSRCSPTQQWVPVVLRGEVPRCPCGGVIKPDITFFGESLPKAAWRQSVEAIEHAELLLILGTSLMVYPAAALPDYVAPTARVAIVNQELTARDEIADLVIHAPLSETLGAVDDAL